MCGSRADLVTDEVRDVDARAHAGVDPIAGRKRPRHEELGRLGTSIAGDVVRRRERQARHVIHGDHMSVAGPARGDALFSDEFPRARPVDHPHATVLALTPDLDMTGQEEVHGRRGLALFDEVGVGGEPFDIDDIACVTERGRLAREDPQCPHEVLLALEAGSQLDDPFGQTVAERHPASRRAAMEQSNRCGRSHLVGGRSDRCSHRDVVWMTGESVGCERDHHIGLGLAEQF